MHPQGIHNCFPHSRRLDTPMCLLIFAHRVADGYPLVLAANRDEFYNRPTAPAQFWPDHPELLAGRDLEQGGTWMGVTRGGRFAAITNYRDPARTAPAPRSRGELPLGFLTGNNTPAAYMAQLRTDAGHYAGFNLLLGDAGELWYFTNSGRGADQEPTCLEPGIYGLSNDQLDTPWPKVDAGKRKLQAVLDSASPPDHDALGQVVGDRQQASPRALARQGLEGEMDQLLSAQFIVTGLYGTRSTTSLWLDARGGVDWRELSFNDRGELNGTQQVAFRLSD